MIHYASPQFWALYRALPAPIRDLADKNYALLKANPRHPSLRLMMISRPLHDRSTSTWLAPLHGEYRASQAGMQGEVYGATVYKVAGSAPERTQLELVLQTTLGPALMATRGYAAPEVAYAYTRARALCQQVGETPQLFQALWGLWYFYLVRAELQTARELGEQLLNLAQRMQAPALLLVAHRVLGQALAFLGEFATARGHLECGLTLYDPEQHRAFTSHYGQDRGSGLCPLSPWPGSVVSAVSEISTVRHTLTFLLDRER